MADNVKMNQVIVVDRTNGIVQSIYEIPRYYSDEQKLAEQQVAGYLRHGTSLREVAYLYEADDNSTRLQIKDRWLYDACGWKSKIANAPDMLMMRSKGQIVSMKPRRRTGYADDKEQKYDMVFKEDEEEISVEVSDHTYKEYMKLLEGLGVTEAVPPTTPG